MDTSYASFINGTCLISLMLSWRSETSNSPQPLVSCSTLSLVTPGKMVPSKGGVTSSRVLPSAYSSIHQYHSAAECCEDAESAIWTYSSVSTLKGVYRGMPPNRRPSDVFRCTDKQRLDDLEQGLESRPAQNLRHVPFGRRTSSSWRHTLKPMHHPADCPVGSYTALGRCHMYLLHRIVALWWGHSWCPLCCFLRPLARPSHCAHL